MPYLSAVCKEGMRVFPSVSMVLPRYVPRGGRVIAGVHLPEKVRPIHCQTPCEHPCTATESDALYTLIRLEWESQPM